MDQNVQDAQSQPKESTELTQDRLLLELALEMRAIRRDEDEQRLEAEFERELERLRSALPEQVQRAAARILDADVLLLTTGAGFSADSGLAVYVDVAKVPAYEARGLQYHDICQPHWLEDEPDLYWGFWGGCFNDYRDTEPHSGYGVIAAWVDRLFADTTVSHRLRQSQEAARMKNITEEEIAAEPYACTGPHAGAFFLFTSNVDAHSFDHFRANEIRECHGNVELLQCSKGILCTDPCVRWLMPRDYRFQVDPDTMLATPGRRKKPICKNKKATTKAPQTVPTAAPPAVGRTQGTHRRRPLRNMPPPPTHNEESEQFGVDTYPLCGHCGAPARPSILQFGDYHWEDSLCQDDRYNSWTYAVSEEAKMRASESPLRVVVLEIGAGSRVPTVRHTSETAAREWAQDGATVSLIRINPGEPMLDNEGLSTHIEIISLVATGLHAIQEIDTAMQAKQRLGGREPEDL